MADTCAGMQYALLVLSIRMWVGSGYRITIVQESLVSR